MNTADTTNISTSSNTTLHYTTTTTTTIVLLLFDQILLILLLKYYYYLCYHCTFNHYCYCHYSTAVYLLQFNTATNTTATANTTKVPLLLLNLPLLILLLLPITTLLSPFIQIQLLLLLLHSVVCIHVWCYINRVRLNELSSPSVPSSDGAAAATRRDRARHSPLPKKTSDGRCLRCHGNNRQHTKENDAADFLLFAGVRGHFMTNTSWPFEYYYRYSEYCSTRACSCC